MHELVDITAFSPVSDNLAVAVYTKPRSGSEGQVRPDSSPSHRLTSLVVISLTNTPCFLPVKMLTVALSCIVLGALALYVHVRARFRPMMLLSERIPGPPLRPVVGNALQFGFKTEGQFHLLLRSVAGSQISDSCTGLQPNDSC